VHGQVEEAVEDVLASVSGHIDERDEPQRMLENVGPIITALRGTSNAVIRIGALLIVKVDDG
jgi:hypothetical protein